MSAPVVALALLWLITPTLSVFLGRALPDDPDTPHAVVAIWGTPGSEASHVRCTGVFVAPEVVLTAASCVLSGTPTGMVQHSACALHRRAVRGVSGYPRSIFNY